MYRNILIPTDGSALAERAAIAALDLAQALGARVTALHVVPRFLAAPLDLWAHGGAPSQARLRAHFAAEGRRHLAFIRTLAQERNVPCRCVCVNRDSPHEAILAAARSHGCDLVFMASHGKRGNAAQLLGSETLKVLTHAEMPVMVHRESGLAGAGAARGRRR